MKKLIEEIRVLAEKHNLEIRSFIDLRNGVVGIDKENDVLVYIGLVKNGANIGKMEFKYN